MLLAGACSLMWADLPQRKPLWSLCFDLCWTRLSMLTHVVVGTPLCGCLWVTSQLKLA